MGRDGAERLELVRAASSGDRSAFGELVELTYPEAYTLALRLMGNEDDARDVVQDAYLRAYKGIRRFRGDSSFSTWLYRIVANCASTQLTRRGKARHEELDDAGVADERPDVDPELRAEGAFERDRVAAALGRLPDRLRAVIVLRDIYDLPHEDIAAELGISEAAAKVRLHRARRKMREHLYPLRGDQPGEESARAV